MHGIGRCTAPIVALAAALGAGPVLAQHAQHATSADSAAHAMFTTALGGGWRLAGMAQAFPVLTVGAPGLDGSALRRTEAYLTQPAIMANLIGPGDTFVLHATLNLEALTQEDGELTFGAWGEGFLDSRHPHTLLHEMMLSVNAWDTGVGALALSAGKGFAPYGTPDPMSRPGLKYPTNHHLSQILERWTLNGAWVRGGWSVEAGVFAGGEPEGPYDPGSLDGFGASWSARISRHWGGGVAPFAAWEAAASRGSVEEEHHGETERTALWNVYLRHSRPIATGDVYVLAEASLGEPEHGDAYFSALVEARLAARRHQPYARIEVATRPEYVREALPGDPGFFRYDHDAEAIGATRWLIATLGWGRELTGDPLSVRPFVEVQYHAVREERGGIDPRALYGSDAFWSLSLGARIFLGGDPMRMGSYGVLDSMTAMNRRMSTM